MTERRKTARRKATRKTGKRTARRAPPARKSKASVKSPTSKRWSQRVTKESDALDLKRGVFTLTDPKKIAASLKRSAEHSSRRKTGTYRSALSMLTFYINRAGKTLPKTQRDRLQRAKAELKHQFGKD
jgi:putative cell wall-binding protein